LHCHPLVGPVLSKQDYRYAFGVTNINSLLKEQKMLSYANMAIDAIQSGKSSWVNTFIKEESVSKPMQQFITAQSTFTKQVVKSLWDISGAVAGDVFKSKK
jgi:hypothetical protein